MFGKRSGSVSAQVAVSRVASVSVVNEAPKAAVAQTAPVQTERRSETYFQTKSLIFGALIEAIDLAALSKLDPESAREEIRDIVHEIVTIKNLVLSIAEQEDLLDDICNDVLGFGPLEPLLARDDIADIMVNGCCRFGVVYSSNTKLVALSVWRQSCRRRRRRRDAETVPLGLASRPVAAVADVKTIRTVSRPAPKTALYRRAFQTSYSKLKACDIQPCSSACSGRSRPNSNAGRVPADGGHRLPVRSDGGSAGRSA